MRARVVVTCADALVTPVVAHRLLDAGTFVLLLLIETTSKGM